MATYSIRNAGSIEALLDEAAERSVMRTHFPGMSYEEGVKATLDWVLGHSDENPLDD